MISTLFALFLALAMHPEVQEKAQKELDSVVGSGRLPTLDDQKSLPYISAIVKEISRWHTVAPIGAFTCFFILSAG
jgi:cytochrome P450